MTADELLREVMASGLGSGRGDYDHCCQFCGFGPQNPFASPEHPEQGPHLPSCLWLKIEQYLKERAEQSG